ncbi:hypothetical protein LQ938_09560 [Microbacterium sp. cx-55]|uniref:hypothetical protein n=1 Tax=Microbacterium sp. cx-55 TaxID=2875948 RepID=UPI001CBF62A8|nr:hypothetical protein [Microbacterium sp. cx-55]MBZ4485991.1 hypothetical protein [Microbacterium sp. cx-55]UGB34135.1 hypothetical protein LQ938_09560 [Microbacterium sp. cx-55]
MTQLADYREELKTVISGVTQTQVFSSFPDKYTPPAILITPNNPYITEGETFEEHRANFQVWVIAPKGDNEVVTDFIESHLEDLIPALTTANWSVEQVEGPYLTDVKNVQFLTVILRVSAPINF